MRAAAPSRANTRRLLQNSFCNRNTVPRKAPLRSLIASSSRLVVTASSAGGVRDAGALVDGLMACDARVSVTAYAAAAAAAMRMGCFQIPARAVGEMAIHKVSSLHGWATTQSPVTPPCVCGLIQTAWPDQPRTISAAKPMQDPHDAPTPLAGMHCPCALESLCQHNAVRHECTTLIAISAFVCCFCCQLPRQLLGSVGVPSPVETNSP